MAAGRPRQSPRPRPSAAPSNGGFTGLLAGAGQRMRRLAVRPSRPAQAGGAFVGSAPGILLRSNPTSSASRAGVSGGSKPSWIRPSRIVLPTNPAAGLGLFRRVPSRLGTTLTSSFCRRALSAERSRPPSLIAKRPIRSFTFANTLSAGSLYALPGLSAGLGLFGRCCARFRRVGDGANLGDALCHPP